MKISWYSLILLITALTAESMTLSIEPIQMKLPAHDEFLLTETRKSLHLSLCAVFFEEEHQDFEQAKIYQEATNMLEEKLKQRWTVDERALAIEAILEEDFSFELKPSENWDQYRREVFTAEYCNKLALAH